MKRDTIYWGVALAIAAGTFAASALLYSSMPERIPIHWDIHGKVDGYGSKNFGLFLTPCLSLGFLVLFRCLPWLSPKNFEVDAFRSTYLFVMVTIVGLFAYIHGVALYGAWQEPRGGTIDVGRVLLGGMFLFFALLGNVMGKVRRNFYIGIRTPWTIASDRVWNDTHRLAAWTMVGGSVLGLLSVVAGLPIPVAFVLLFGSMIVPVVYSLVHYKRLERRGAL